MGESAKIDLQGRVEALDRAKSVHEKSLSRRQELLDDMEARIKALKERVSELTDCLAKAEDDAREREDALEEKLQEMGTQFEEAKITFNKENATRMEFVNLLTVEKEKLGLQVSRLHDETVELKDQISVLKITNYDVGTQLEGLKASNSMFEDEAKELNEKIDKVNQDASFSKALCVDLKSKLEAAERLLDESDAEINTLSYDCDCLEKKVENLNAQLECHDGVISDQKAQIESLLEDIAVMKGEKKSLIEDLESQMAKVLLSEEEKLDLVERIESLEASLNANEDTKLKVMSERDSLKSTADDRLALLQQLQGKAEIRQSELLDSLAAKEFEIASLTSQREELKGKLEDLGYRFDQLLIQSKKDSESFQSRLGQLLDEISTVNAQKDNYALQTKSLEAKVERIEAQSIQEKEAHKSTERQLLMDVRNSQNTISGAKLKLIHVENELQSIKSQLTAKDSEISKLVDEKERLANELCTALDKVEMEVKANALTQNEHTVAVKQLVTDVEKKHALCVDLTSRLKTLTSAMNVKQEEVISLKNDLSYANESIRMLQSEKEMSMSTLESKLLDTRSQFEAERQSLKELIGDLRESQQSLLEQRASSIEASLRSQFEISRDEISNAKRIEGDLRERLEDVNTLLHEKIHEIQELNSDILSEKEGRRQELFEMKCLYEKKFQELTSCSLDIEAEKSISENKVKKLTQDVAVSLERESSLVNRIHELEQLLQSQNHDLVQVNSDLSAKTAAHDKALSDMERTYAWNVKELKDLHDTERNELLQQMSDISGKLKLCQVELIEQRATQQDQKLMMEEDKDLIQHLRAELEEGINLNASLSTNLKKKDDAIEALQRDLKRKEESLIAADRDYKAKIEEKKSFHEGEKQNLVDEIAKFSMELEWSLDQIDKKQKIIDSQRLSLNDENNELVKELSKANNTEMKLRKLFNEAYMEVSQLSIDFASTRGDIVFSIAEARSSSEETLLLAFQTFKATAVKWAAERVSYEDNVKSLSEDVHELNKREQHLRSQVDALRYALEVRDQTVDELSNELTSAKNSLSAATSETQRTRDLSSQVEELRFTLESRDQSIEDLSIELISVKENLSATDQEFEHVKAKLGRLLNELNEMNLINANLREEMSKLETAKQLSQSKVETATTDLNDLNLKNEFLLDEIDKLKSDLRACHHSFDIERGNYESNIAFISSELKSSSESFALEKESFRAEWRHFQLLLKHLVDSIDGKNDINEFNSSKHSEDLPDISTQLGKLIELVGNKEELILQLQLQIENLQIHHDQIIEQHTSSEEDPETIRLLSEIEEAKIKVIGMDSRFISERKKRKDLEAQLSAESKSLTEANKELTVKESIIDELEESVQLKLVDIKKLESRLCKNYDLHEKLEGKYEVVKSELEVSQNLATELKQIIIDKVSDLFHDYISVINLRFSHSFLRALFLCCSTLSQNEEIESKEGRIMELQFQVDDLASQADGWRASLEALTSEADGWKATLQDLKHGINDDEVPTDTEILSLSSDLRDELSKEIVRLEEKILVMDKDQRQQCSMHKSIVDGLEARCDALSQENTEAQGYISSLEDSKVRLQVKINSLRNDCDVQRRRLSELESVFIVMKQQKSVAETLCDDVLSGLRKLTGVAIMYSSRLEGFSEKLSSPSSWSVNLEYISRFIECALKLNQKYFLDIQKLEKVIESLQRCGVQNIAEAITPKAKGSGDCRKENSVMPQHLDVINDIKNMKDAIKNLMTSPKLTPEKGKQMSYTEEDKDGDLYSDLLTAYDQLEVLSKKIVTYQDDQALWKDRESTLQARIKELEADKLQPRLSPKAEDLSGAEEIDSTNLNESSAVIVSTDTTEQDLRKAPQTEALKHANIVKAITRELNSTRKKVHELKTKLIIDTR
jgi:chromosome segregation ATPase